MEILFPTGNKMIDPRISYANEPGFTHAYFLLNPKNWLWTKEVRMREAWFICITDSRIYNLFTFVREIDFSI